MAGVAQGLVASPNLLIDSDIVKEGEVDFSPFSFICCF